MKTLILIISAVLFVAGFCMMLNANDNMWINILGGVLAVASIYVFYKGNKDQANDYL